MSDTYRFKPHARLLTMLGEQLIRSDSVALTELAKNSYDADASFVEVEFRDFARPWGATKNSAIVITDNGLGMTPKLVRDVWLSPATAHKNNLKKSKEKTELGRVMQGDKGIGRFAMFKIGRTVQLITRHVDSPLETVADVDLEAIEDGSVEGLLEDFAIGIHERAPEVFTGVGGQHRHGTQIRIGALRGGWTKRDIKEANDDLVRLQPLSELATGGDVVDAAKFTVRFVSEGQGLDFLETQNDSLLGARDYAVLTVVGSFDQSRRLFDLMINDHQRSVPVDSSAFMGTTVAQRFLRYQDISCGDFNFEFLIFDLRPSAPVEHKLDKAQIAAVRSHRIYLFRDGIRVLPYGSPDDDWLQLDVIRGTLAARHSLSNDQTVGMVHISQNSNPELRDKTSREGLLDTGAPYDSFIGLLQSLISYMRATEYARYLGKQKAVDKTLLSAKRTSAQIAAVRSSLLPGQAGAEASQALSGLERDQAILQQRAEQAEDLAGVGLSVEMASHDIVAVAGRVQQAALDGLAAAELELGKAHHLTSLISRIVEGVSFISSRLHDIQGLFVSSRRKVLQLDVAAVARRAVAIYSGQIRLSGTKVEWHGDKSLTLRGSDAVFLQIFLNLIDNSLYWMEVSNSAERRIVFCFDEASGSVIVGDTGPGINPDDEDYIFQPFYSGKGDEGRGLGLYIGATVAQRNGYDLRLAADGEPVTSGANFVVDIKAGSRRDGA